MTMKPSVAFLEAGAQEDKLEIIFLLWYVARPQSLVFFQPLHLSANLNTILSLQIDGESGQAISSTLVT